MAYKQGNTYGLQKVEETDVRTGKDIAFTTAGATAQGALAGSQFGPIGSAVGGTLYGGAALFGSKKGQRQEEQALVGEKSYNEFVDGLDNRVKRDKYEVNQQARYGMNAEEGMDVEIEKDELVYDKDWNELYDAKGDKKHKDGGKDVKLPAESTVMNTQDSKYKKQVK